jgi:cysteine-rich repeat protein
MQTLFLSAFRTPILTTLRAPPILVTLLTAACFAPNFSAHPACGDSGECPSGTQCLREVCIDTSCADRADGVVCASVAIEDGVCLSGGCVPAGCGDGVLTRGEQCDDGQGNSATIKDACRLNCTMARCGDGVIDSGEACDDSNLVSGDGCSADCRSNETCGNGIVDIAKREMCDEGVPGLSGDGCSSICSLEVPSWEDVMPAAPPISGRLWHAMAYDSARGKTVLFGGLSGGRLNDTWEFDGAQWTPRTPATRPAPRAGHVMTFDSDRNKVIMFAGQSNPDGASLQETWEYDGRNWLKRTTQASPSGDGFQAMTFDSARNKTVWYGGGETWEYDGDNWKRLTLGTTPGSRTGHAMTFDSIRNKVVLFGGSFGSDLADTWEYDGINWTQILLPIHPQGRQDAAITFDSARGKVILYGGQTREISLDDTWEYDGVVWVRTSPALGPLPRSGHEIVFDSIRRSMFLFGGFQMNFDLTDTWRYSLASSNSAPDQCSHLDTDGDGRIGCGDATHAADPDCASRCTPSCRAQTTAIHPSTQTVVGWPASCALAFPNAPHCGDGICNPVLESKQLCPQDCP